MKIGKQNKYQQVIPAAKKPIFSAVEFYVMRKKGGNQWKTKKDRRD